MKELLWNTLGLLSFLAVVLMILRRVLRDTEKDLNMIAKQANCFHGVTYMYSGKRLCATCGKTLPTKVREVI